MKVMVTGGAGYIGSITAEVLLAHSHDVLVFDNLFQGHRDAVPDTASWVQGDLAAPDDIREAIAATLSDDAGELHRLILEIQDDSYLQS